MLNRKPKQSDVASLAGVSQATVSQVLNNNAAFSVPLETRQRVQDAIIQLGYVPNGLARSLRTQKTHTIASVLPDIANPFYPSLERGVQDVAEAHGFDLVVYNTDGVEAKERRALDSLLRGRVDGVVGVFFHLQNSDLQRLLERQLSVVLLEEPNSHDPTLSVDRVFVDNAEAAETAVSHLLERGHRRIGMLSGPSDTLVSRVGGYYAALKTAGLDPCVVHASEFTEVCGYSAMLELLSKPEAPTAVFAANDVMAMGALVALRERGLRVPDDISLIGFDDIPAARVLNPALTTIAQFPERLGRRAAELLFQRLEGHSPAQARLEKLPYELILRESTGPLRTDRIDSARAPQSRKKRGVK